jgi:hypothetical protein
MLVPGPDDPFYGRVRRMSRLWESCPQQHALAVRALDEILAAINELENEDALDTIVRIINDARGSL